MDGTTPLPILVRTATIDDAMALYELLEVMREEGRYPEENPDKLMIMICETITKDIAIVIEREGKILGSAGLKRMTWRHSDAQYIGEMWVFVHPDARRSRAALMLIRAMQDIAVAAKLPLMVNVRSFIDTELKMRFFARYMTPIGGAFIWHPGAQDVL